MRFLVVGYGNSLRCDDAVGPRVLDRLEADGASIGTEVRALRPQQLTPELAEDVSGSRGVVFVDAREGAVPGEVRVESLGANSDEARVVTPGDGVIDRAPLTHALSAGALLEYADRLFGARPPAAVVTVTGERFGVGERLSARVEAAIPEAARRVREIIDGWALEAR